MFIIKFLQSIKLDKVHTIKFITYHINYVMNIREVTHTKESKRNQYSSILIFLVIFNC